ncbi:MAG: HAD family hydrolase [Betaproteobacteria bacterium]
MSQVLLFDLGGVLVDIAHYRELRALKSWAGPDGALRELWAGCAASRALESGCMAAEEFGACAVRELGLSIAPQAFVESFRTWTKEFFPGALELLAELRKSYRIGCLSNSNALHWAPRFETPFHFSYSSHLIGHMKPEAAAFEHVLREQRLEPASVVFLDDSETNVAAARRLGMLAHHVLGFPDLVQKLEPWRKF